MKLIQNAFTTFLPNLFIFAALVACSQPPGQNGPGASNDPNVKEAIPTVNVAQADQTGDVQTDNNNNAPFRLSVLSAADMTGVNLKGELGCNFTADNSSQPMLVAQGDVASNVPARGIVKVGNIIEKIAAGGGFNAMSKGTTFVGEGFELRVLLTGPAKGEGESPPRPAMLTAGKTDGAMSVYAGRWHCGP